MNLGEMMPAVTALLLAGGRGSRMGGVDKGLQPFGASTLAWRARERLSGQSLQPTALLVNANRHFELYAQLGGELVPDTVPDFAGPLAGFLAGLSACRTPLMLTVPCDVPHFPLSLCERLTLELLTQEADIAMAAAPEDDGLLRPQPVFCLLRAGLAESLAEFMAGGGRKIDAWTALHHQVIVPFDTPGDDPRAFANANTLPELRALDPNA